MNRAIFLDRDGTINVEKNYLYRIEDFRFEEGVLHSLKQLYLRGYKLFVVSNQSGIARGYFSEDDLFKLHKYMENICNDYGFKFEQYLYCPHHPDGVVKNYRKVCDCRKPKNLLIEDMIKKYSIDREGSYFIGDKRSDIEAGLRSGLTTILVGTGYGERTKESFDGYHHFVKRMDEVLDFVR